MNERAQQSWATREPRVRPVHGRRRADDAPRRSGFFTHDEFTINSVRVGVRQIVAARGQLVVTSAWQLELELRRAEATDAAEILLDLAGLKFIDAIGMEVLIHACARVQFHGKQLMIGPAPEAMQRMFERSGLAMLMPFVDPLS